MRTNITVKEIVLSLIPVICLLNCLVLLGQDNKRPNIIFIMTDDQSAVVPVEDDIGRSFLEDEKTQSRPFGFNGDTQVHTPIIDNLAKDGIIFTRAYVSSSVCAPSRYSMLTGKYAGRSEGPFFMRQHPYGTMTRVENNTELEAEKENLPRLLQKAGYRTGFVGKSHLILHHVLNENSGSHKDPWVNNGLKYYDKGANPKLPKVSRAMSHNHDWWAARIKEYGFDYANGVYAANLRELFNDSLNVHNVEWKNKAALEFIETSGDEPFFLYYSETVPHGPSPWIKKDGKYVHSMDADPSFTGEGYIEADYTYLPSRSEIMDELRKLGKNPDHAWLRWLDHAVGAVVNKLMEVGKLENTLIVITSDHGNYNLGKTTLYEGGVRVPLMMYWPNGIASCSRYSELVQNIDFAPTFLDLAGVDLESVYKMDGKSLKPVLFGKEKPIHDHLFFELGFARAVMTKDWKYIALRYDKQTQRDIDEGTVFKGWNGHTHKLPYYTRNSHLGYHAAKLNPLYFDKDQLFNLNYDPREKTNVYKENPEKAHQMKEVLISNLRSFPQRPYGEFLD